MEDPVYEDALRDYVRAEKELGAVLEIEKAGGFRLLVGGGLVGFLAAPFPELWTAMPVVLLAVPALTISYLLERSQKAHRMRSAAELVATMEIARARMEARRTLLAPDNPRGNPPGPIVPLGQPDGIHGSTNRT